MKKYGFGLIFLAFWGVSCEDAVDNSKTEDVVVAFKHVQDPARGFWTEKQGVGPNWYTYELRGHQLVVEDYVFVVEDPEGVHFFSVDSYYNEMGESGYFRLTVANGSEALATVQFQENVKTEPVCFQFAGKSLVSCDEGAFDLMFASPRLSVPGTNVVPQNPSIFTRPKPGRKTYLIDLTESKGNLSSVNRQGDSWKSSASLIQDVYVDPKQSRLSEATKTGRVYMHLAIYVASKPDPTTGFVGYGRQAVAWHYVREEEGAKLEYICGDRPETKTPFAAAKVEAMALQDLKPSTLYGIRLCDDLLEETEYEHGLWPRFKDGKTGPLVKYSLFLWVTEAGEHQLFASPNTSSWAYGERHDTSNLEALRAFEFEEGAFF